MRALQFHFTIHQALWDAFERRRDSSVTVGGHTYPIEFQDTPLSLRTRTVIKGITFESQNMRKDSPNTTAIEKNPNLRYTWGFKRRGAKIDWITKVGSTDTDGVRKFLRFDLKKQPNQIVASEAVPLEELRREVVTTST